MATGKLASIDIAAVTMTALYTTPVNINTVTNVNICNRNAVAIKIRMVIVDGAVGTFTNADYIEYDLTLSANSVIERTGIVLSAGNSIGVYSDTSNVSAVCWGYEDSTL